METVHTVARDLLLGAFRHVSVAGAAGIGAGAWLNRVLSGNRNGYISDLHRGRLPAIEIYQVGAEDWVQLSADSGGMGVLRASWGVRVHVSGANQSVAEALARLILYNGLVQARGLYHFRIGNDNVGQFQATALGYMLETRLDVELAMGRSDYELDGNAVVWLPGGMVEATINFDDASPSLVFAVPAGAIVAEVSLHVVTAFDGASPTATVGTDADPAAFLTTVQSDLTDADSIWEASADEAGPVNVNVTLVPGAGATQGQITVRVTIALAV